MMMTTMIGPVAVGLTITMMKARMIGHAADVPPSTTTEMKTIDRVAGG
ncbi:MAG: hypothetical protein K8U57_15525 [Planctomycetes bacterium]|nr:hypothetical protein [Planctomycetota bacterium]